MRNVIKGKTGCAELMVERCLLGSGKETGIVWTRFGEERWN